MSTAPGPQVQVAPARSAAPVTAVAARPPPPAAAPPAGAPAAAQPAAAVVPAGRETPQTPMIEMVHCKGARCRHRPVVRVTPKPVPATQLRACGASIGSCAADISARYTSGRAVLVAGLELTRGPYAPESSENSLLCCRHECFRPVWVTCHCGAHEAAGVGSLFVLAMPGRHFTWLWQLRMWPNRIVASHTYSALDNRVTSVYIHGSLRLRDPVLLRAPPSPSLVPFPSNGAGKH